MRCESRRLAHPEGMKFCGLCGRPLAVPQVGFADARTRNCVGCGHAIGGDVVIRKCCGHDLRAKRKPWTEDRLLTGAVLALLAGISVAAYDVLGRRTPPRVGRVFLLGRPIRRPFERQMTMMGLV